MSESLTPNQAFDLQVSVVEQVASQRSSWVPLAGRLAAFHSGKGWTALGLESFNEWLAQPEISLSRNAAYNMIAAWRELVVDRELEPEALTGIDLSKLAVVLPAIRQGKTTPEDALSDCESLSRSDLRARYQSPKHAEYRLCESCGQRMKVTAE